MGFRISAAATVCLLLFLVTLGARAAAAVPTYGVQVVRTYPHDPDAFTEGLFYKDGFLYESTGMEGSSFIRKVELATGKILQQRALDRAYFGEGAVDWKGALIELTWRSGVGFVYDLKSFAPRASFHYAGEGWGLTQDGRRLIMSDGTAALRFFDPRTLVQTGRVPVTADGAPVDNLNELEWVRGEVYANVWRTDRIAVIDPETGAVTAWLDLAALRPHAADLDPDNVLNGIAYDARGDRLFVTGKRWPMIYEIRLVRPAPKRGRGLFHRDRRTLCSTLSPLQPATSC